MNASKTLLIGVVRTIRKIGTMPYIERDLMIADVLQKGLGIPCIPHGALGFGSLLPDGNWSGLVGQILKGEIDISTSIAMTEERLTAVSFGYPLEVQQVTFVTEKPHLKPPTYAYLRPFMIEVWIALMLTTIIISVIFCASFRGKYKYERVFISIIGSLLQQSWTLKSNRISKIMMVLTWLVGTMFLTFSYTAVLLSFLTFPPKEGIRDIAGLAKAVTKGTHKCLTYSASYIPDALLSSDVESYRVIGANLKKHAADAQVVTTTLEVLEKEFVVVGIRNFFIPLKERYFMPEDNFFGALLAPAYGKNFCCKRKLDTVIRRATEAGIFDHISEVAAFTYYKPQLMQMKHQEDIDTAKQLSISDLWGAFAFLFMGYLFAFLVLLIEKVHFKFANKC